ncbi:hypothetical protein [Stenotrophomonas sp.]|uniref:hypothetical protein n=1 Tax=Stenotrophomonas sp. TaxID=69392 RepID=UPI0028A5C98B|nr:hypothetical protein [Stenotrophomonas sp.]
MEVEATLIEMTKLVREFAVGAVGAKDFIESYSSFYHYEALDGHEASSALLPEQLNGLGPAIELHRRIQEEVVNRISLDGRFSVDVLEAAGRIDAFAAREVALRICADVGVEAVMLMIGEA